MDVGRALMLAGDRLRNPFGGLDEEQRLTLACACYAVHDLLGHANNAQNIHLRDCGQMLLGALYAAELIGGEGAIAADAFEQLCDDVVGWLVVAEMLVDEEGSVPPSYTMITRSVEAGAAPAVGDA